MLLMLVSTLRSNRESPKMSNLKLSWPRTRGGVDFKIAQRNECMHNRFDKRYTSNESINEASNLIIRTENMIVVTGFCFTHK